MVEWNQQQEKKASRSPSQLSLTPADEQVAWEIALFREGQRFQQVIEVESFHKKPVIVCTNTILG